jgi:mannose-1-phosphate guanylyltransferase
VVNSSPSCGTSRTSGSEVQRLTGGILGGHLIAHAATDMSSTAHRWSVILAGGDGVRLRPLTRLICGDDRPKQFCPLLGEHTLFEMTRRRLLRCRVAEQRILVSLSSAHRAFYQLETGLPPTQRVVQPLNRGTAPPIVHSMLSIAAMDPDAAVAVVPCDHYFTNEDAFESALNRAFEIADHRSESVVLLGAHADYPEPEYGWIEPASLQNDTGGPTFRVGAFREKPTPAIAQRLFRQGCLWNTFVMVGRVSAFLEMVGRTVPALSRTLAQSRLWNGHETHVDDESYCRLQSSNFSHHVLGANAGSLLVLPLDDTGWTDLGNPVRAAHVVARVAQHLPQRVKDWLNRTELLQAL